MRRVLSVLLLTVLAACASRTPPEPRGPDAAAAHTAPAASAPVAARGGPGAPAGACAADADCVSVKADCCGCTAGGKATAVPRAQQAAYETALAQRCGTVACIQMMSNDPSCGATPRCVSGACRLGR